MLIFNHLVKARGMESRRADDYMLLVARQRGHGDPARPHSRVEHDHRELGQDWGFGKPHGPAAARAADTEMINRLGRSIEESLQ